MLYIFKKASFLKKDPHSNVPADATTATTTSLSTPNVLLQSKKPSEKLHSGKYDVATYAVPLRERLE